MFEGPELAGLENPDGFEHNVFDVGPQGDFLIRQLVAAARANDFGMTRHPSEDWVTKTDDGGEIGVPLIVGLGPADKVTVLRPYLSLSEMAGIEVTSEGGCYHSREKVVVPVVVVVELGNIVGIVCGVLKGSQKAVGPDDNPKVRFLLYREYTA